MIEILSGIGLAGRLGLCFGGVLLRRPIGLFTRLRRRLIRRNFGGGQIDGRRRDACGDRLPRGPVSWAYQPCAFSLANRLNPAVRK